MTDLYSEIKMLAVTFCLFVALFVIATADVLVRIKAGTHTVALYYPGKTDILVSLWIIISVTFTFYSAQLDEAHPVFNETVVETFLEVDLIFGTNSWILDQNS